MSALKTEDSKAGRYLKDQGCKAVLCTRGTRDGFLQRRGPLVVVGWDR
jgi:hypothetical protein